jgi:DNA-binding beta-propeller fold protein YncE
MLSHFEPFDVHFSRRALVLSAAAAIGCGRRKVRGFPGRAFVANAGEGSVAVVDLNTFALTRQIAVGGAPGMVVRHPVRESVYVLLPESGALCEIDASALRVARRARLSGPAISMRLAADTRSLWVLQPGALVRFDGDRLRALQSVRLPGAAAEFDLSHDGRAAVTLPGERALAFVKLDSGRVERVVSTGGAEPFGVIFQSDGKQALVGSRTDRSLTIFDVLSGRIVVRLPLPIEPANFCFNSDGGQLFITGPGMDVVVIVYPYQTEVGETILAGNQPDGMAVSSALPYLFVANPQSAAITVLNIDTRKLVAAMHVGQEPHSILITPDDRYALVLNRRSGDMAVIRIAAFTDRRHRTDPPPLFTMVPVGERPVSAAVVAVG